VTSRLLHAHAGFDIRASSLLSLLPWLVMAIGSSASGLLADGLVARGANVTSVRKGMQSVAFLGPVAALLVLASPGVTPPVAVLCMTAALGITSLGEGRGACPFRADPLPPDSCRLAAPTACLPACFSQYTDHQA
jgi:hypothetical protein